MVSRSLQWLRNVARLSAKELRSLLGDVPLVALILFAFTISVYTTAKGVKAEVSHASVGWIDADQSALSWRLRDAIRPPYFQPPRDITAQQAGPALDRGDVIFVIDIPPHFEADVLAGRAPAVQVTVDATAMTQAGLGVAYLNEIFLQELLVFFHQQGIDSLLPAKPVIHLQFNPNNQSHWFTSVMLIITNITVLAIILVGAAVIREREHGTIEHLLVMPVRPSEIAVAKIAANGLVILVAVGVSLWLVVRGLLEVPPEGSAALFLLGTGLYLFSLTALGILLATVASSMPQFGLLAVPVFVIMYLLSGSATPRESMPLWLQHLMLASPSTHYTQLAQGILYRAAGADVVWPQMLSVAGIGVVFLGLALMRFRTMLARQG